jgi:hypothetical protein
MYVCMYVYISNSSVLLCVGCTKLDSTNYIGETVKMVTVDSLKLTKLRLLKVTNIYVEPHVLCVTHAIRRTYDVHAR